MNDASCGVGVEIVNVNDYESIEALLHHLLETKRSICEELIQQSDAMSALHPQSVNTIRVATIVTGTKDNYDVNIFHPFLKIGQHGSVVDNPGAGGIAVKIHPLTGILCSDGCDEANNRYLTHPDTDVLLNGFQLPDWNQAVSLAKELALVFTGNRCTGWDLAHTKNGWVMVEGNARGQFVGQQMCDVVGKMAELKEIMMKVP